MRIQIKPETMKTNPKIRIIVPFVIGFLIIGSCIKERPYAPDITTASITAVTSTNAKSGGAISDDGGVPITARGVCWMEYSYTSSPTIEDKKTSDGSGTGTFQSSITGLTVGKKYSVRAYATDPSVRNIVGKALVSGQGNDEAERIRNFGKPFAILHGAEDQLVNKDYINGFQSDNLWRNTIHSIINAGHTPQIEQPEVFNSFLLKFLKDIQP